MSLKDKYKRNTTTKESFDANEPKGRRRGRSYLDDSHSMYKPQESDDVTHRFRFITILEARYFAYEIGIHFNLGAERASACCPAFNYTPLFDPETGVQYELPQLQQLSSRRCPACEMSKKLYQAKQTDLAKEFRCSTYQLTRGIDRTKPDDGPLVWPISGQNTIKDIRNLARDPENNEVIIIDDLDEGYDIFFKRYKVKSPDGKRAKYLTINDIMLAKRPTPLSTNEAEMEKWLEQVFSQPLTDALQFIDPEEMEEMILNAGSRHRESETDDEDDESEKPASASDDDDDGPDTSRTVQHSADNTHERVSSANPSVADRLAKLKSSLGSKQVDLD